MSMKTTTVHNQAGAENSALLDRIGRQFKDSAETKRRALEVLATPIALATELMVKCLLANGKILACGNGGSAAIANHLLCDFEKGIQTDTSVTPRVVSLSTNIEIITAISNDIAYEEIFIYQLRTLAVPGDVLMTISASGDSENVVRAAAWARDQGLDVIAFTGDGGLLMCLGELATAVQQRARIVLIVFNDGSLSLIDIKQQQRNLRPAGVRWKRYDFAAAARAGVPVVQTLHNFRLLCPQAMFLREGRVCEDCLGKLPWRGVVHRCCRGSVSQSAVLASMIGVHRAIGTYRSKVSRYIALTEFSRAKFIAGGLLGKQISVKPNFVDLPAPENERQRAGALFVGRLSPEKGTRVLARAAATRRHAVIDVIGTGPERSSLEASPGIRLLGWQAPETIYARMRGAAFLVAPSICYENFPRAIVEAFACGLPVIASRLGAMAEIVRDGATGLLFEAGNAEDLAQKMAWAEATPDALREMGANARREYEAKYTPAVNYRQLMKIYADAIAVMQPRANNP